MRRARLSAPSDTDVTESLSKSGMYINKEQKKNGDMTIIIINQPPFYGGPTVLLPY